MNRITPAVPTLRSQDKLGKPFHPESGEGIDQVPPPSDIEAPVSNILRNFPLSPEILMKIQRAIEKSLSRK